MYCILNQKCLVDEEAKFVNELGEELSGKFVLDEGNKTVLKLLGDNVLHLEPFYHSYPYDWRSKQPVIIRASMQWFIDTAKIKQSALVCNSYVYINRLITVIVFY